MSLRVMRVKSKKLEAKERKVKTGSLRKTIGSAKTRLKQKAGSPHQRPRLKHVAQRMKVDYFRIAD